MKLLPLVPYDIGGVTHYLVPSHPFVRHTWRARWCRVIYFIYGLTGIVL